jgi:hypothetical protein
VSAPGAQACYRITQGRDGGIREELAAGIGRVLINAQIALGCAILSVGSTGVLVSETA